MCASESFRELEKLSFIPMGYMIPAPFFKDFLSLWAAKSLILQRTGQISIQEPHLVISSRPSHELNISV
jgi:hypothetical protein